MQTFSLLLSNLPILAVNYYIKTTHFFTFFEPLAVVSECIEGQEYDFLGTGALSG